MSRWNLAWLIGLPAAVVLGLTVVAKAPPPSNDYELVRSIVDVLAEVDRNYVNDLTDDEKRKLVENMINGGLERLDPHSMYFNADALKEFDSQIDGQFVGIGVKIQKDPNTGYIRVESPLPGSPAYEAGVQADDYIVKVGATSTQTTEVNEARDLIMGPVGTPVTLTLRRQGDKEERVLTLTRGTIEVHPVTGVRRDPTDPARWDYTHDRDAGIAHIRVVSFTEKTTSELQAAVKAAEAAGARAIILDLRDNPGGLLTQAADAADLFLDGGPIVSTGNKRSGGQTEVRRTWSAGPGDTIFQPAAARPMAVLINGNSASASEILASALQDHNRAAIVGERTYGKGSVQKIFPLSGETAVKLTTEIWLTPKGKNIHRWPDSTESDEWGVRPDVGLEVEMTDDQRRAYVRHVQSLDIVRGKPGDSLPPPPPPTDAGQPYVDPVVEKAAEYLREKLKQA